MNEKIKILHIITNLPIGGAQENTLYTLELLDKDKYDISLACNMTGDHVERAKLIPRCKIYNIKALGIKIDLVNDIKAIAELVKLIRKGRFDIVHTHSSKPGVVGRLACFFSRTPIVIHTVHGFPFHEFMTWSQRRFYIAVEKAMNVITTHLITVSTLNLKKIVRLRMAKQKSLTNIYSGIDIKKFSNSPKKDLRDELYLSNSVKLIGFIGRFSEQKSPLTLLRAVGKVVNRCHDCHFLFVGDGPKKSEMESFVQHNKLDEKVSFLGFRLDIPEILHSLDLFVLSSIYEGLGRSITEALCCKVPVVATAVEGVPELIRHKKTGLLVRPNDPVQLSNAIIYALENPERMKQMANVGSLFVRENFDVSNMVKKIDAVYTSLINV